MSAATTSQGNGPPGEGSFASRAARLPGSERSVYRRILRRVIDGTCHPLDALPAEPIAALIEADLIQTDGNDRLTVAYPFSAEPTRHRVTLHGGRSFHAMCAIDALGIPYMLGEPGEIQSREPETDRLVRVSVDPDREPTWTPAGAVALAAVGEGACLAQAACPHINLFASADTASRYLETHALQGGVLSITDATSAGRWVFGDLLHSLDDAEAR
jgi:Alkylmercury lyase